MMRYHYPKGIPAWFGFLRDWLMLWDLLLWVGLLWAGCNLILGKKDEPVVHPNVTDVTMLLTCLISVVLHGVAFVGDLMLRKRMPE